MNTTTESPATLPDYVIAKQELEALFQSLHLTGTVTGAHVAVDEPTEKGGKGWAHVALTVIVKRALVIGKHKEATVALSYKMGLGLADWRGILKRTKTFDPDHRLIEQMIAHRLAPWAEQDLAGKHLSAFVKKCSAAEVLASYCRDGEDAATQTFTDWCDTYGYDQDSRKAEATYRACQDAATTVRKVLSRADVVKFAELSGRL